MKYSVLISGQREPGILPVLGITFHQHGVLPDFFCCEAVGSGCVQIRVVMDCEETMMRALVPDWRMTKYVQSVVVSSKGTEKDGPHET